MNGSIEDRVQELVRRILNEPEHQQTGAVVRLRSLALDLPAGGQIDLQEKARKMNPPFLACSDY